MEDTQSWRIETSHMAEDASGCEFLYPFEIEAEVLTENSGHDANQEDQLQAQMSSPINSFGGDGTHDQWNVIFHACRRGD